ncbi:hypothetical protein T265_05606 [Opisthorchis viverrini]|uniref:Uncharacterized protein n=1 Tax=Opisthorchis viverrini TaxID=6198 RepID=A0A074ZV87_OPIVI|nr:hypothetical protein T265_05606 [Opisthorchis viverrini]KER27280.1 hypothetical protein T265_05606 [Opisthorchis viverrini]
MIVSLVRSFKFQDNLEIKLNTPSTKAMVQESMINAENIRLYQKEAESFIRLDVTDPTTENHLGR